jgi:hypothetical protein
MVCWLAMSVKFGATHGHLHWQRVLDQFAGNTPVRSIRRYFSPTSSP